MLLRTEHLYPEARVGSNVKMKIPTVDRTRLDLSNLIGIIMEIRGNFPMYKIGTRSGKLAGFYNRKDFETMEENFLQGSDVPDIEVDLRKAAADASLFGGQGVQTCSCRGR